MAEKMQRKPYTGDARAQIRDAGIWGFWKVHREVAGPDGEVIYPAKANRLDYEGELAIVLSKRGTDIRPQDAKDYVWGVTLLGDWSIRNPREPAGPHNFAMGKNFDTSCSLGPCSAVGEADPSRPMSKRWSTASAASISTPATWCFRSANTSNTCRAT
jgi:2-keto-4-pentenoate hydratase/2-oxohepta-3-ene-1,7-dioic acid hydratase in catechol pathway